MPASIDDIPAKSRYPWDEWLDGELHTIDPEVEYSVAMPSLRAYLHNKARERGGKVKTKTTGDNKLAFQFVKED